MAEVRVINRIPEYHAKSIAASILATKQMAADVLRLAKLRAPYDPGTKDSGQHLVATGKIKEVNEKTIAVSFSDTLPYGRWWEYNDTHPRYGTPVTFQGGRQSKYLHSSAEEISPKAPTYYATALR